MRDNRFVAVHRGGSLTKDNHRKLIRWARACAEHVLSLIDENVDERLIHALNVAKEWEDGNGAVGDAMKASLGAHAVARETTNPISIALARSIGQAVATAHMSDHALGAAMYALKAVKLAGKSIDQEKEWQETQLKKLPSEIVELVFTTRLIKEKGLKI
jgi:hypothetical protein